MESFHHAPTEPRAEVRRRRMFPAIVWLFRALALEASIGIAYLLQFGMEGWGAAEVGQAGVLAGVLTVPAAWAQDQPAASRILFFAAAGFSVFLTGGWMDKSLVAWVMVALVLSGALLPPQEDTRPPMPINIQKYLRIFAVACVPGFLVVSYFPGVIVLLIGGVVYGACVSYYQHRDLDNTLLTIAAVMLVSTWISALEVSGMASAIFIWPVLALPVGIIATFYATKGAKLLGKR